MRASLLPTIMAVAIPAHQVGDLTQYYDHWGLTSASAESNCYLPHHGNRRVALGGECAGVVSSMATDPCKCGSFVVRFNYLLQRTASVPSRAVQEEEHSPRRFLAGAERDR